MALKNNQLQKLEHKSLRNTIVEAIRDAIVGGFYRGGEKIQEQALVEQLGVSRTPIREALSMLEQQGLLETRHQNGFYVTKVDWAEVKDSLNVRMVLEEFAIRQAIQKLTVSEWDDLMRQLHKLFEGILEAIKANSPADANKCDIEIHTSIITAAHNTYLSRIWSTTSLHYLVWSPERENYPFTDEKWSVFIERHRVLLADLVGYDPDICAAAIRNHITGKLNDLGSLTNQTILEGPTR